MCKTRHLVVGEHPDFPLKLDKICKYCIDKTKKKKKLMPVAITLQVIEC